MVEQVHTQNLHNSNRIMCYNFMHFDGLAKHLSTLNERVDRLVNVFNKFAQSIPLGGMRAISHQNRGLHLPI